MELIPFTIWLDLLLFITYPLYALPFTGIIRYTALLASYCIIFCAWISPVDGLKNDRKLLSTSSSLAPAAQSLDAIVFMICSSSVNRMASKHYPMDDKFPLAILISPLNIVCISNVISMSFTPHLQCILLLL